MAKQKLARDRLRRIIKEEKDKLHKEQKLRSFVRQEIENVLHEGDAQKAAEDADQMMSDNDMDEKMAANAAAKKHDVNADDVMDYMGESNTRRKVRKLVRKQLNEVRPKDFRTGRRKLARYLESHAITDTQMDDLVSLVSQQGLPGGLDEWMDMHAEAFNNLNRDRLEELLVSSGVAQA